MAREDDRLNLGRPMQIAVVRAALWGRFDPTAVNGHAVGQVALFPRLGIAFNRIKKNANSSVTTALHQLEEGELLDPKLAKASTGSLRRAWPHQLIAARRLHYVVIVRDPFSRTLSAFLNRFSKPEVADRHGGFDLTPSGFGRFLAWLEDGNLAANKHWDLQRKLMFAPPEAFDTVLPFESFPHSFVAFLAARGHVLPAAVATTMAETEAGTRTHARDRLAEFYDTAAEARARRLFAEDFAFLGYPDRVGAAPPGIDGRAPAIRSASVPALNDA